MANDEQIKMDIKKLKNKRSGIKVQLNSIKKFLDKLDLDSEESGIQLNYRVPKLKECFDSYIENYEHLVELSSELENDENLLVIEDDRCEFENSFYDIKYKFEKVQNHFTALEKNKNEKLTNNVDDERGISKPCKLSENDSRSEVSDDNQDSEFAHKSKCLVKNESKSMFKSIRLPQITLPRFDGKLDKWLRFRDSFTAMIINNTELTDVERFYYLEGNVDGEAKNTIDVVEFSDEGFKNAWSALIFKYDNSRCIVDKHMNAFFNMKSLTKESATDIRKLLDDSLIHMRALESLGEKVTDVVEVHTVKHRLD